MIKVEFMWWIQTHPNFLKRRSAIFNEIFQQKNTISIKTVWTWKDSKNGKYWYFRGVHNQLGYQKQKKQHKLQKKDVMRAEIVNMSLLLHLHPDFDYDLLMDALLCFDCISWIYLFSYQYRNINFGMNCLVIW